MCLICEQFSKEYGVLVKRPLKNLKKAKEKLNEHFGLRGRESHQAAVERALAFCAIQENRAVGIDQQINSIRAKLVAENKMKLKSITATVIFCGRQGLAFRGHRDDGPVELDNSSTYKGCSCTLEGETYRAGLACIILDSSPVPLFWRWNAREAKK